MCWTEAGEAKAVDPGSNERVDRPGRSTRRQPETAMRLYTESQLGKDRDMEEKWRKGAFVKE